MLSTTTFTNGSAIIFSTVVIVHAASVVDMHTAVGTVPRLQGCRGFAVQFPVVTYLLTYSMEKSPS
jgi:hypothetical protein